MHRSIVGIELKLHRKKTTGISHAERLTRIDCHKIHTVALLVNARIRNRWLNDELLQVGLKRTLLTIQPTRPILYTLINILTLHFAMFSTGPPSLTHTSKTPERICQDPQITHPRSSQTRTSLPTRYHPPRRMVGQRFLRGGVRRPSP